MKVTSDNEDNGSADDEQDDEYVDKVTSSGNKVTSLKKAKSAKKKTVSDKDEKEKSP